MLQPPWKTIRNFLIKGNTCLLSDPAILPPRYIPKRNDCMCPQKEMYKNFKISFIHNTSKLETTQIFIKRKMIQWSNK